LAVKQVTLTAFWHVQHSIEISKLIEPLIFVIDVPYSNLQPPLKPRFKFCTGGAIEWPTTTVSLVEDCGVV
jgi:hypothetical protein